MSDQKSLLALEIFQGLSEEEFDSIHAVMTERTVEPGEFIFRQDQPGDSLYIIQEGEVEVMLSVGDGVEETLATLQGGSYFGEIALVDRGDRSASVRARTHCRLLSLVRRDFFELAANDNALGLKMFLNLSMTLTDRLRTTTEMQRKAVYLGHQISGASHLNFHRLIANAAQVSVELSTGKDISGVMLKVEETRSGHEITLKDAGGAIHVVPYHAISQIIVSSDTASALEAPTVVLGAE